MKIIFFGSSQFAVPILEALASSNYKPYFAVTEPDAPVGRKQILTPTPVAKLAEKLKIKLVKFAKLDQSAANWLQDQKPDLCIVASYGKILPKEILGIPKFGFLNAHPSLLPKFRGPTPIQSAILAGEKATGVTILQVDEQVDHGPILASCKLQITSGELFSTLSEKLAKLGAKLLLETIPKYIKGEIKPKEQDHSKATFTKLLPREDGHIDWHKSAEEIERMSRAYEGWPGIWSYWTTKPEKKPESRRKSGFNKRIKILKISILNPTVSCAENDIGRTFLTADQKLAINCKTGTLLIEYLQLEGSKPQHFHDFLNGHPNFIGSILQ